MESRSQPAYAPDSEGFLFASPFANNTPADGGSFGAGHTSVMSLQEEPDGRCAPLEIWPSACFVVLSTRCSPAPGLPNRHAEPIPCSKLVMAGS